MSQAAIPRSGTLKESGYSATMMKPVFDIEIFRNPIGNRVSPAERRRSMNAILHMMEALCQINGDEIRYQAQQGKPFRPLYQSGVVYKREPPGEEYWQDVYTNFKKRDGDCEDLACHRIAELRTMYKMQASPFITFRLADGQYYFHAIVAIMTGGRRLEDPSRKLGMGWEGHYEVLSESNPDKLIRLRKAIDAVQVKVSQKMLASGRNV